MSRAAYWALMLVLLAARTAGAHVHLCLDGQEPPATLHVADAGVHHTESATEEAQSGQHDDRDVRIVADCIYKQSLDGNPCGAPGSVVVVVPVAPANFSPATFPAAVAPPTSAARLLPPPRAPPR